MLLRHYLLIAISVILLWWPICYLLNGLRYKRRVKKLTKNLPALDDYPLVGGALRFWGKNNEEMMDVLKAEYENYQTPYLSWMGPKCIVVVDNPLDIQAVLTSKSCIEKSNLYEFFNNSVGLFGAPAHIWKKQRKQVSPSFNSKACWSFLPSFNRKADEFIENIGRNVDKGHIDILKYSAACALDMVCETFLDTSMNIQNGKNVRYVKAMSDWMSLISRRMSNPLYHLDIIYKQTQLYLEESKAWKVSDSLHEKIINQKTTEYAESNILNNNENDHEPIESSSNLMECLMKLQHKGIVSQKEIRDHINLLVFAGQDTSSYTIAMTLLMLTLHPAIEQRVMDELNNVFGDLPVNVHLTMEQINSLTYLEQVIKETLRLYPVAPCVIRRCTEDTQLANFVIPKDTDVAIPIITAHRRKDVWGEDADEFNPDHFNKEVSSNRNPFAFMAFSNGPRNCLGRRFAFISIKTVLAKVLRKYRFSTGMKIDDLKFCLEITCKPVNGVLLEVIER